MFAEPSPFSRKVFLNILSYPFERPDDLPGNMVTVDHNGGLGEASLCDLAEMRVHIHNEVFDVFLVLKLTKIPDQIRFLAVWKNVHDLSALCVGQDRLVFLAVGIPLEFINRENLRELFTRVVYEIEIAQSCADRNVVLSGYVRSGNGIPKILNNTSVLPARHAVVAREKAVFLVKPFTAAAADISSFAKMKVYILPKG